MPMPPMLRTPLTAAALAALAAMSTAACSTTTDPVADESTNSGASQQSSDPAPSGSTGGSAGDASDADDDNATTTHSTAREFSMLPGDSTALAAGGSLRYLRIINDSRCKPDVQCIWAGDAELSFQWQKSTSAQETFSLHTNKQSGDTQRVLGSQRLALQSLAATTPEAQLRLEPAP